MGALTPEERRAHIQAAYDAVLHPFVVQAAIEAGRLSGMPPPRNGHVGWDAWMAATQVAAQVARTQALGIDINDLLVSISDGIVDLALAPKGRGFVVLRTEDR